MNKKQRYFIFLMGALIGCIIVSSIFSRKVASRANIKIEQKITPWRGKIVFKEEVPIDENNTKFIRVIHERGIGLIRIEEIIKQYPQTGKNIIQNRTVVLAEQLNILTEPGTSLAELESILSEFGLKISKAKNQSNVYQVHFTCNAPSQVIQIRDQLLKVGLIKNVQLIYIEEISIETA